MHDTEDVVEGNLKNGIEIPQPTHCCRDTTEGEKVTIGLAMALQFVAGSFRAGLTGRFDGSSAW
jgi:hypothetical protein